MDDESSNAEQVDALFRFSSLKEKSPVSDPTKYAIPIPARTELYYPMTSQKRGRCFILNYKDFIIDQPVRHGTEHDVNVLEKTFKGLGFEVDTKHDLSKRDTKDTLDLISTLDHEKYDCFALCILSHGDNGVIYCNDGTLSTDQIMNMFTASRCPSLVGKPKLFFIQACQGDMFDAGTLVHDSLGESNYFLVPTHADFLIFYSTYPGYFAWRNAYYGSWFIQDLCAVLQENAHQYDLMTMLTLTAQRVAFTRSSNVPTDKLKHMKKQMPYLVSTLTRLIRFGETQTKEHRCLIEDEIDILQLNNQTKPAAVVPVKKAGPLKLGGKKD